MQFWQLSGIFCKSSELFFDESPKMVKIKKKNSKGDFPQIFAQDTENASSKILPENFR